MRTSGVIDAARCADAPGKATEATAYAPASA